MLGNAPVSAVLTSSELARSKAFYEGTLGLNVMMENEGSLFFQAGGGTSVVVYLRPGSVSDATIAGFQVENVEEAVEALAARGVVFEIYDMPNLKTDERGITGLNGEGMRGAWFKDPDGNILSIAEM